MSQEHFELAVIGSGPAGQKAAIQAAKAGHSVLVIEREPHAGGGCVQTGTIPSKTLRETAAALVGFRRRTAGVYQVTESEDLQLASMMARLDQVIVAHRRFVENQLARNGITLSHGRARFVSPHELEITQVRGAPRRIRADFFVIATGSRPREPNDVVVDHEHVLDSDSILALNYLPRSLTVLGAGVIAAEYASIFAALGVKVTMLDKAPRPVGFLDAELSERFLIDFREAGGRFIGGAALSSVRFDGVSSVITSLDSGEVVRSEKALFALGRSANVEGLGLAAAEVEVSPRGFVLVDEFFRTRVPHIYAAGDVIGPPALAASSAEQGRRAACHAFRLPLGAPIELTPVGVYTIPEMACVGLTEAQARERHGGAAVGRARFAEIARGQIAAAPDGLLKLVAAPDRKKVLGVHVIGECASELVHLGQMALIAGHDVDIFVDTVFNFPTFAEAYRVAAFEIVKSR